MARAGHPDTCAAEDKAQRVATFERLVAVCDVDDNRMAAKLREFRERSKDQPAPKAYCDYRKLLEECQQDIDVVLIATPDHHHAPAAIRAIHLGKAVFAQKPLAHNIYECYALAKAAREKKVLTQMGNQGHCSGTIRKACEYIWAGAIGNVTETHSLLGRDFGGSGGRPASKPVPPGLHWDEWLGPAPYRDYHEFSEDTLFVGDQGLFRTGGTCGSLGFLPEDRRREIPDPAEVLPRAHGGPIEDLFHACKHGTVPCSNFPDSAAPLTAFALAGHLAQFAGVGKKLEWDVEQMKCTNLPEINRYVRRTYRPGWEV